MSGLPQAREVLVIGGGLAGCMAALRLRAGRREVLLIEKERGHHHKVCGEFLSPEAVIYLRDAGVDPLRMGAVPIERLRVSVKRRAIQALLPFPALSLSRRVLDAALLGRAEMAGCEIREGTPVRSLIRDGGRWTAQLGDGRVESAHSAFLATGKHDLHGWSRPSSRQNDLVGFKMHWRLQAAQTNALRGFMDLFLFESGYGGLALVEADTANLCLVIRRSRLRRIGAWRELVSALCEENEMLRERLDGAVGLWERPLAVSSIPYGYVHEGECGAWRVGDQAAVIPSFTGDGMAIALHSGMLAAEIYLGGGTPSHYHRMLRQQLRRGMLLATGLSRAMVTHAGQELAAAAIPVLPQPLGWIARLTRIPESQLCRTLPQPV